QDITASLNASQVAKIAATEINLALFPNANNANNGSTSWIYSIPNSAFDFLTVGEKLTLTYLVTVNNNYAPLPESSTPVPLSITITGTEAGEVWSPTATGKDNLWITDGNWASNLAPKSTDDVTIVTDQSGGLAPAYPVLINAG